MPLCPSDELARWPAPAFPVWRGLLRRESALVAGRDADSYPVGRRPHALYCTWTDIPVIAGAPHYAGE